ncbi:MAG: coproporphyrinogen III oxidase [Boseongicola sp. SB0670_bin_30]|nr:coproporphyrinogen III oxidase [Boseongicola sp. SB0670_bin_30]
MDRGFGVYVHWPFCQAKCPYCDFNSHVAASIDHPRWQKAFLKEIVRIRKATGPRNLSSIFFGGGTPSLMAAESGTRIVEAAKAAWPPDDDIEITLEANPTSVEAGRFRAYAKAGVNRLSLGIQSLRDPDLKALGRLHTSAEAVAAYDIARSVFPRVSFDLIYARQNQTAADWEAELAEALELAADHVSLYQLTIEPGTVFGDRHAAGRLPGLPEEGRSLDMFNITQDMTVAAGLPAYEISNHARPGKECRHNLVYWRSGSWAGIGPGAHGRLTVDGLRVATESHSIPDRWLDAVETNGSGYSRCDAVSAEDAHIEAVMTGLRLVEGVTADLLKKYNNIKDLIDSGHLERAAGFVRTTRKGRPLLDAVLREILLQPVPVVTSRRRQSSSNCSRVP